MRNEYNSSCLPEAMFEPNFTIIAALGDAATEIPGFGKSGRCHISDHCVGVARAVDQEDNRHAVMIDTKDPEGPRLAFGEDAWQHFVDDLKADIY